MTILQIRAAAPLLVAALLSSLGCENDGSGSNTLLFNGGVGPSPTSSSLIVKRPDVSAAPPGSIAPTLGLPPTLNVPPTLGFPPPSTTLVNRGVFVGPDSIQAQRVATAFCPIQAFVAPFNVVFTGDGRSDLFLNTVQMQFVDLAEIRAGTRTLGRPELAVQFGTTAIPAVGTRAFPFAFPFACDVLPTGTLTVIVVVADSRLREATTVRQLVVR